MIRTASVAGALSAIVWGGLLSCTEAPPRAGVLRVCLYEADAPRSTASVFEEGSGAGSGFDVDVAQLVAARLNQNLQLVWLRKPPPTEIESTDVDYRALTGGGCDLQLSIPDGAIADADPALELTDPYYGTGYELIPSDGDLMNASRVAVRTNSVAHVVVDRLGLNWTMQRDAQAIVEAVSSGAADVGLIWGPELALLDPAVDVERNADLEPMAALRWNQHMAVRRSDASLKAALNSVLASSKSEIVALLDDHGLPPHPPFAQTGET